MTPLLSKISLSLADWKTELKMFALTYTCTREANVAAAEQFMHPRLPLHSKVRQNIHRKEKPAVAWPRSRSLTGIGFSRDDGQVKRVCDNIHSLIATSSPLVPNPVLKSYIASAISIFLVIIFSHTRSPSFLFTRDINRSDAKISHMKRYC